MFIHKKRQRCKEDQHFLSLNVESSPVWKKNKNPAVILTQLTIGCNTRRFFRITPRIKARRCQWHRCHKSNSLVCCLSSRFPIVSLTTLFMAHVERDAFSNLLRELYTAVFLWFCLKSQSWFWLLHPWVSNTWQKVLVAFKLRFPFLLFVSQVLLFLCVLSLVMVIQIVILKNSCALHKQSTQFYLWLQ